MRVYMLKRGPSDSHAHEVSGIPNAARTIRHAATVNPLNCLAIIFFSQKRFTALPGGTNNCNTPKSIVLYTPVFPRSGTTGVLAVFMLSPQIEQKRERQRRQRRKSRIFPA